MESVGKMDKREPEEERKREKQRERLSKKQTKREAKHEVNVTTDKQKNMKIVSFCAVKMSHKSYTGNPLSIEFLIPQKKKKGEVHVEV